MQTSPHFFFLPWYILPYKFSHQLVKFHKKYNDTSVLLEFYQIYKSIQRELIYLFQSLLFINIVSFPLSRHFLTSPDKVLSFSP